MGAGRVCLEGADCVERAMRRALPWLGLLILAASFVWLVRLPVPMHSTHRPSPPPAREEALPVVVLDAGHGGQDSGAMCGLVMEKDLTLDVAQRAEMLLRAAGYSTVLTRESDRYVSLPDRAAVGNDEKNCLFVSIHFNDGDRPTASGVETYYAERQSSSGRGRFLSWLPFVEPEDNNPLRRKSESLAGCIQAALVERTRAFNRGTKAEEFFVISNVRHPAALVEGGFMTNESDATKLATSEYRQQIAIAISHGVVRYREVSDRVSPLAVATGQSE